MPFMKPVSRQIGIAYGIGLGMVAVMSVVPGTLVTAQTPAADKVELKDKIEEKDKAILKDKTERGRFVSFKDGTLTLQANSGAKIGNEIPENTKTLVWNHDDRVYKPADTAEALHQAKLGTWFIVQVAKENVTLRIGSRKGETIGTFVSFKNDRLLILGKNLGESYVKKYGSNVHFNKFREDVPIYESVDGGEYQVIGTANKILGDVREGTILTVHGEGDDNITLIQIGVPKKK